MKSSTKKLLLPLEVAALAALVLTGAGCNNPSSSTTPSSTTPSSSDEGTAAPANFASYKDGTYTAEGDYVSPGGPESIDVTLTLASGVVTDANVVPQAQRQMSIHFQGLFASGYKTLVVGKNLNDIHLDAVSGSSLTPNGFNDAVQKIKAQAGVSAS